MGLDEQKDVVREPREKADYQVGDEVEYHSFTHTRWLPCKVTKLRPGDNAVELDIKPNAWMLPRTQRNRLRRPEDKGVECNNCEIKEEPSTPLTPVQKNSEIRALVIWNDYNWSPVNQTLGGPFKTGLDTEHGARKFKSLLHSARVTDITELSRTQCTRANLTRAIYGVGSKCNEDDYFILYYTGHGSRIPDTDFDEDDGFDEALVLVDETGQVRDDFLDDDLALYITSFVKATRIFLIMDCCHSASAADLHKPLWKDKIAISMSGCADNEESLATGSGGVFTNAIVKATEKFKSYGEVSAAHFYNQVFHEANHLKSGMGQQHFQQTVSLKCNRGVNPSEVAWPLL